MNLIAASLGVRIYLCKTAAMFAPYSLEVPFDAEEFIRCVPVGATQRGMFFDSFQKALRANNRAPLDGKWIGFKRYPQRDYLMCIYEAAVRISGDIPRGLFEIGRFIYPDFAESLTGKTLLKATGGSFAEICAIAPRGFAMANNYGEFRVLEIDDSYTHVSFDGLWDPLHFSAGIVQGVMDVSKVKADSILYKSSRPGELELKIEYSAQ